MVESIDDCMQDILAELKKYKIDENTLIIFTSDNGGLDRNGKPTENAPLRSGKGCCYEGGIRVPFLRMRWPAQIPSGKKRTFRYLPLIYFPQSWRRHGNSTAEGPSD